MICMNRYNFLTTIIQIYRNLCYFTFYVILWYNALVLTVIICLRKYNQIIPKNKLLSFSYCTWIFRAIILNFCIAVNTLLVAFLVKKKWAWHCSTAVIYFSSERRWIKMANALRWSILAPTESLSRLCDSTETRHKLAWLEGNRNRHHYCSKSVRKNWRLLSRSAGAKSKMFYKSCCGEMRTHQQSALSLIFWISP